MRNECYAYQWKHTSCRYNIENADGFRTFSKSVELTEAEQDELNETVAHYERPEYAPRIPSTTEELNDRTKYPIAFTSFNLSSGKSVVCRARYVGKEYDGSRFENFFAHALVLSDGAWENPLRYVDSPTFADGLKPGEANLEATPDPLWSIPLSRVEIGGKSEPELSPATRALVDGFVAALRRRQNLVVFASPERLANAAKYIGDLLAYLPPEIASKIEFTTYERNPTNSPLFKRAKYVFLAFAPTESKRYVKEDEAVAVDLDAAFQEKLRLTELYAGVCTLKLLEFSRRFPQTASYDEATTRSEDDFDLNTGDKAFETALPHETSRKKDARALDLAYLNQLAIIGAMKNNFFPQIEGNYDVWTNLNAEQKANPKERWLATWRFLDERSFDVRFEIAQELLRLELHKGKRAEATSRRLAPFILSYAAKLWRDFDERRDDRRKSLKRSIIDFWTRSIPAEDEAFKMWRAELPREIEAIFAFDRADVTSGSRLPNSARKFFDFADRDSWKTNDLRAPWLELALSFAVGPKIAEELRTFQRETASEAREQAASFSLEEWIGLTLKL